MPIDIGASNGGDPSLSEVRGRPQAHAETVEARRLGLLAAALFASGGLFSVPSSLLLEPRPPTTIYLVTAVALCSALICLVAPWERLGRDWLNLVAAAATLEIAGAIEIADASFGVYYFFVAIYAGYAIRSHAALLGHLALITCAFMAPVALDSEGSRETIRLALLFIPGIAIAGGTVAYLRELLEEKQRIYQSFAEEAFELVTRIRGKPLIRGEPLEALGVDAEIAAMVARQPSTPDQVSPGEERSLLDELSRLGAAIGLGRPADGRGSIYRPVALGAALAAISMLGLYALAHAGVSLPEPTRVPFDAIGISLPNQDSDPDHDDAAGAGKPEGSAAGFALPSTAATVPAFGFPAFGYSGARTGPEPAGADRDNRDASSRHDRGDRQGGGAVSRKNAPGSALGVPKLAGVSYASGPLAVAKTGGVASGPAKTGGIPPGLAKSGGVPPGLAKRGHGRRRG